MCYQSFDYVGVKVGGCCLQGQSRDSSSEAGLLVKDGGPPHAEGLWQSSSVMGLSLELAPEDLALLDYSPLIYPPEEEPAYGSAQREVQSDCLSKERR